MPDEMPVTNYAAWELGYRACVSDVNRVADGTPGHEYTSNPYSLGDPVPAEDGAGQCSR